MAGAWLTRAQFGSHSLIQEKHKKEKKQGLELGNPIKGTPALTQPRKILEQCLTQAKHALQSFGDLTEVLSQPALLNACEHVCEPRPMSDKPVSSKSGPYFLIADPLLPASSVSTTATP